MLGKEMLVFFGNIERFVLLCNEKRLSRANNENSSTISKRKTDDIEFKKIKHLISHRKEALPVRRTGTLPDAIATVQPRTVRGRAAVVQRRSGLGLAAGVMQQLAGSHPGTSGGGGRSSSVGIGLEGVTLREAAGRRARVPQPHGVAAVVGLDLGVRLGIAEAAVV